MAPADPGLEGSVRDRREGARRDRRGMLIPRGIEETAAALRKQLGRVRDDDEDCEASSPSRSLAWCTPPKLRSAPGDVLTEGADVAILLSDGSVFVGSVISEPKGGRLRFRAWGVADVRWIAVESVHAAKTIGPHRWADRRAVCQRQRRGEPAIRVDDLPNSTRRRRSDQEQTT